MRNVFAIALAAALSAATPLGLVHAYAAPSYKPPVMRDDRKEPITFFGRLKSTGRWCSYDLKTWKKLVKRDAVIGDEFGWMHYDARGPLSVTFFQQSEDAFAEDQYFVGPDAQVSKMVRTGAVYEDPLASVSFEPDPQGRLRLSASAKVVVQKMKAAGYGPYWVDWDHYSKLGQMPFSNLLSPGAQGARSGC
jgi:hypothetical protein